MREMKQANIKERTGANERGKKKHVKPYMYMLVAICCGRVFFN